MENNENAVEESIYEAAQDAAAEHAAAEHAAAEQVAAEQVVIEVQSLGLVNGAIGVEMTTLVKEKKKSKVAANTEEKVAIRSTKNVSWGEVGKVYRGINIVTKSQSEKWLTRSHITLATPEEVAKEFGN